MPFGSPLDPVLFGVLTAAVEEESALAYEAGFSDGLRAARFRLPCEDEDDVQDVAATEGLLP
jgi:hypothetical protein